MKRGECGEEQQTVWWGFDAGLSICGHYAGSKLNLFCLLNSKASEWKMG